jgi:hypothetical protein
MGIYLGKQQKVSEIDKNSSLSFAFRQRCEAIAVNERHRLGLQSFDPLSANVLADCYRATLLTPIQLPNAQLSLARWLESQPTWFAAIIYQQPLTILYNPNCSAARHQSNIMHEFGHVLLKHPMNELNAETGMISKNAANEREAAYQGACLQLPKRALEWAIQSGMSEDSIMGHYTVSQQMVQYRCRILRLTI